MQRGEVTIDCDGRWLNFDRIGSRFKVRHAPRGSKFRVPGSTLNLELLLNSERAMLLNVEL